MNFLASQCLYDMFEGDFPAVKFYEFYSLNYFCTNFDSAIFVDIGMLNDAAIDFSNQCLNRYDEEYNSYDQQPVKTKTTK